MPLPQQLRHDLRRELGMPLQRDDPLGDVHALHLARIRRSERLDAVGVVVDEVEVRLEYALVGKSARGRIWRRRRPHFPHLRRRRRHRITAVARKKSAINRSTYQSVFPTKQLLALLRQDHATHADLPRSGPALGDLGAQRPSHDLVAPAHADELDPVLREDRLDEVQYAYDPGVVVEGVEVCGRALSVLAHFSPLSHRHQQQQHPPPQSNNVSDIFFFLFFSFFHPKQKAEKSTYGSP